MKRLSLFLLSTLLLFSSLCPVQAEEMPPHPPVTPSDPRVQVVEPPPPPDGAPEPPPTSEGSVETGPAPTERPIVEGTAPMIIEVRDGRTGKPLAGAEVVIAETEERFTTGRDGKTGIVQAPVIRDPRYRPMIARLHGQLTLIAYKNGYRDAFYFNVRLHEGRTAEPTIFMYKITPQDTRIEPTVYINPLHRIWVMELAEKFRRPSQPGEGPQDPQR